MRGEVVESNSSLRQQDLEQHEQDPKGLGASTLELRSTLFSHFPAGGCAASILSKNHLQSRHSGPLVFFLFPSLSSPVSRLRPVLFQTLFSHSREHRSNFCAPWL